jgi:hypothetical protein
MRFIRLLGAVIIFYGLSYLLHALMQISSRLPYRTWWASHIILISINLTIGIVTCINGLGLLLAKKWSRVAWLITVTALLLFHDLLLLLTYLGGIDLTQQMLNVFLIFFLAAISWTKLPDPAIKKYFA